MKNMMKTFFAIMALAMLSFSFTVRAENVAEVKKAIEETLAKVEETIAAAEKGGDGKALADMALEAKQLQKSISSSDAKIQIKKSKGSNLLGQARNAFNDGDLKKGGALMSEALSAYKEVKEKFDSKN